MNRTRSLTLAAALATLLGVVDIVASLPILAAGRAGMPAMEGLEEMGGPPFAAGVVFLSFGVMALFGAYGLWLNQKWGKVVTIVTRLLFTVVGLGDLVGMVATGKIAFALLTVLYTMLSVLVIYWVLRRERSLVTA